MVTQCDICGKTFQDGRGLAGHKRYKHKDINTIDSNTAVIKQDVLPLTSPLNPNIEPNGSVFDELERELNDAEGNERREILNDVLKWKARYQIERYKKKIKDLSKEEQNEIAEMYKDLLVEDEDDDEDSKPKDNTDSQVLQVFEKIAPYLGSIQPKAPTPKKEGW